MVPAFGLFFYVSGRDFIMTTTLSTPSTHPAATGFGLMLYPSSIEVAKEMAKTLANSGLVPQAFAGKPDAILIAGAMGARLGLDIFSALAGIAVVNGRPTLWGDAQLAVCQARQDWGGMVVAWSGDGDDTTCTVTISRKGVGYSSATFSISDALTAGLWGKQGPWKQYPRRMVELRARAFAIRAAYADALAGFAQREEMEDAVEVTAERVTSVPDAQPAKVREIASAPAIVDPVASVRAENTTDPVAGDEPVIVEDLPADITTEFLQKELTVLWRMTPNGKDRAKAILAKWNLLAVSDMGGTDQEGRAQFLGEVRAAVAEMVKGVK